VRYRGNHRWCAARERSARIQAHKSAARANGRKPQGASSMGQTASQIESHIAAERDQLQQNILVLDEKAREAVDWRTQFNARPRTMLAIAFAGGIVLAKFLSGRLEFRTRFAHLGITSV